MSEKRRRRRRSSMGSDESEGEEEICNKSGEASVDGNDDREDPDDSDSAVDEEEDSFKGSGDEADREGLYPNEAEDSNEEPEEGDDEAKVDHDEDKRNPQYIPKKGMFYEHDDRVDSEEEAEAAAKEEAKSKKVWKSEVVEKWGHDKFLELEQTPKSKEELIQAYGYDIRNEDNAPRARRRRRYGRGPSKYTRSWQDEDQYQKQGPVRGAGPGGPRGRGGQVRSERPLQRNSVERDEERRPPPRIPKESENNVRNSRGRGGRGQPVRGRGGRSEAGPPRKDTGYSANSRLLNRPKPVVPADDGMERVEKDLTKMRLDGDGPRRSDKPKRYSSQRQRQHGQNDQFYEGQYEGGQQFGGGGSGASNGPPPNAPFIPNQSSTAQRLVTQAGVPTPYMNPQGMVNYGPPPVQYTVPVTAVGVTVPLSVPPLVGVAPETFPAHGTMPIAGGTVTAVGGPLLAPHLSQGFPGAAPAGPAVVSTHQDPVLLAAAGAVAAAAVPAGVPTQGGYAEVRGGVTYFNPTAQPPSMARPPVNKRPKAAIPIVDPSEIRSGSLSSDGASPQQSVDQYEQNNSASSPETSKRVMEAEGEEASSPPPPATETVAAAT